MMNMGRCPRCHKFLVAEEAESHVCKIPYQGVKSIFFDWMMDATEDENGDIVRVANGLDGYYYRLVVCKHNPPHTPKWTSIVPSNDQCSNDKPPPDNAIECYRGGSV